MSLKKILVLIGLVLIALSGCSNEPPAEQVHGHLEEAVALEQSFAEQQDEVISLEEKEKEIYNEIINLRVEEDMDQIKSSATEAISVLDEKEELISSEKESIDAAKKEFDKASSAIEDLEEENAISAAEEVVALMDERYEAYNSLYEAYGKAIEEDRTLYELLQEEDLTEEEFKNQLAVINELYENILTSNETFNEKTQQYNEAKAAFYEAAGLEVAAE